MPEHPRYKIPVINLIAGLFERMHKALNYLPFAIRYPVPCFVKGGLS